MNEPTQMENFKKLDIPQVSLVAAILALIFNTTIFIIGKTFLVSFFVPKQLGSPEMIPLGIFHIFLASILPAFLAGFIFWTLTKVFREKGIRDFLVVCSVFFLFSLGGPLSLSIPLLQKIFLVCFHIATAFCISWTFFTYHRVKNPLPKK